MATALMLKSAMMWALGLTWLLMVCVPQAEGQFVESFCSTSDRVTVPGQCRPLVNCLMYLYNVKQIQTKTCQLHSGEMGVCCPNTFWAIPFQSVTYVVTTTVRRSVLQSAPMPIVPMPFISKEDINRAVEKANLQFQDKNQIHQRLQTSGNVVHRFSPTAKHRLQQKSNAKARRLSVHASKVIDTSANLVNSFNLSPDQGRFGLSRLDVKGTLLASSASQSPDSRCSQTRTGPTNCQTADPKFRSITGVCNNLQNPHWGESSTALMRLIPAEYDDGISIPRGSSTLPPSRTVTSSVISGEDNASPSYTLLLMQWGQFLDHDLTHTPINKAGEAKKSSNDNDDDDSADTSDEIKCCTSDGQLLADNLRHPECFPIIITQMDPFYGPKGKRCMEFVRSMPAELPSCGLGAREQVNQITAFLDGSNVYGSDISESKKLRLGRGGRMRVTRYKNEDLLPLNPDECSLENKFCFAAGDGRVNEQPQLTLMHTVWLREHNRIAVQLSLMNPAWDDERLYQETRKIVGAEMQHITYNEWLPIILGQDYMLRNGMLPNKAGFSSLYDANVNPSIANAFATAAFRFGHSLVQGHMEMYEDFSARQKKSLLMHQHQFAPFELYNHDSIDGLIRGLTTQPSQDMDPRFTKELTERLFQGNESDSGMDLVALNLQRGRDHGLPPYTKWRQLCGLSAVNSWKDFSRIVISPQLVPRLQQLYGTPDKVDLFLGGVMEKRMDGSLLGPTFHCIIGDQFLRLRLGDRFFYEEGGQTASFTPGQLNAIRMSSMARIMCDNGNSLRFMQPMAFRLPSPTNQKMDCFSNGIPRLDLEPWRQ